MIAGSVFSLASIVLYDLGIGTRPLWILSEPSSLEFALLLFISEIGVSGAILSTWRFALGGALLFSCGVFLIFFPGLFTELFFFNPAIAALYLLSASIMLGGGILSLRKGILHLDRVAQLGQELAF